MDTATKGKWKQAAKAELIPGRFLPAWNVLAEVVWAGVLLLVAAAIGYNIAPAIRVTGRVGAFGAVGLVLGYYVYLIAKWCKWYFVDRHSVEYRRARHIGVDLQTLRSLQPEVVEPRWQETVAAGLPERPKEQQAKEARVQVERFKEVVAAKPDFAHGHCCLGIWLGESGQMDDAIASFRKALELQPNHADAHYYLGVALRQKGEHDAAQREFAEAERLNPKLKRAR